MNKKMYMTFCALLSINVTFLASEYNVIAAGLARVSSIINWSVVQEALDAQGAVWDSFTTDTQHHGHRTDQSFVIFSPKCPKSTEELLNHLNQQDLQAVEDLQAVASSTKSSNFEFALRNPQAQQWLEVFIPKPKSLQNNN